MRRVTSGPSADGPPRPADPQRTFMNHRRSDVRAAVFRRRRSQGHLRAVTATVGVAGVVTAGAVAAILPGSAHAAASSPARGAPARSAAASSATSATPSAPASSAPASAAKAARPSSSSRPEDQRTGGHRPGGPGARRDHRTASVHVRRLLTWLPCPGGAAAPPAPAVRRPSGPAQVTGSALPAPGRRARRPAAPPPAARLVAAQAPARRSATSPAAASRSPRRSAR